jgi:hypothetical protein
MASISLLSLSKYVGTGFLGRKTELFWKNSFEKDDLVDICYERHLIREGG